MFEAPEWLVKEETKMRGKAFATAEERLRYAVALAARNVKNGGGPFGAAVFEGQKLVAIGVNLVMVIGQSDAHAEMVAISRAQDTLKKVRLENCTLASSCEPCAMCTGGILWSGVGALEYAAAGKAARAIGFDEGDKIEKWEDALRKRGIAVAGPLLPDKERLLPFTLYQSRKGVIY